MGIQFLIAISVIILLITSICLGYYRCRNSCLYFVNVITCGCLRLLSRPYHKNNSYDVNDIELSLTDNINNDSTNGDKYDKFNRATNIDDEDGDTMVEINLNPHFINKPVSSSVIQDNVNSYVKRTSFTAYNNMNDKYIIDNHMTNVTEVSKQLNNEMGNGVLESTETRLEQSESGNHDYDKQDNTVNKNNNYTSSKTSSAGNIIKKVLNMNKKSKGGKNSNNNAMSGQEEDGYESDVFL